MSDKLDCTYQQAVYAVQDWYNLPRTGLNQRNGLRAGQYVWDKYGKAGQSFPELYYAEHPEHVMNILYKHFH